MSEKITVYLEEEYGYRYWLWETGMTEEELRAFWGGLPSVSPYFYDPRGLPGKLTPLETNPTAEDWTGHIHMDDDSGLWSPKEKVRIKHGGYREE